MIDTIRASLDQAYYDSILSCSRVLDTQTVGGDTYECRRHNDGTLFVIARYAGGAAEILGGVVSLDAFFKEMKLLLARYAIAKSFKR